jgi:ankyrin repeat protein
MNDQLIQAKRWIEAGETSGLRLAINASVDLRRAQDEAGRTLVNFTCRVLTGDVSRPPVRGTPEQEGALDVLLQAGCDVALADHEGFAPLHVAAMAGHHDLAKRLLDAGAPRTGRVYNTEGGTPLGLALFYGEREVSSLLADPPEPDNLRTAAGLGRDLGRFFQDDEVLAQASVGTEFTLGWRGKSYVPRTNSRQELLDEALRWAAMTEQLGSMDELCRRGANVNASPFRGTPLTYAAGYNKVESVRWLLNHGADPNLRHDFGGEGHGCNAVALHLAAQFGALDTLRVLVEHGANLNTRDGQFNATPLQWAAHAGADNSITLLRELGAE